MSTGPSLPDGFLGAQPTFSQVQLETDSHKDSEFKVKGDHEVVIKLKARIPVKVVSKLTQCCSDTELAEYVLVQRGDKNSICFHLAFPDNGSYTFMIFALEETESAESLANVYNYLIHVEGSKHPAQPYAKAYTKFYSDCCFLKEPLSLTSASNHLDKVRFEVNVPGAEKVAVHCVEEWFHLRKKGQNWQGTADVSKYKGKDSKVKVMANYTKDSSTYNALLEYTI